MTFRFDAMSVSQRIITAMVVMSAVVAAAYCLAVAYGIGLAEEFLIGRSMDAALEASIGPTPQRHVDKPIIYAEKNGKTVEGFAAIPDRYHHLDEGFSEVLGQDDHFVLKRTQGDTVWIVEQNQFGFEDQEMRVFAQTFFGLVIAVFLSLCVGFWLAHSVTRPIRSLSERVTRMAKDKNFNDLNISTPKDEIDSLALTVQTTLQELHEALEREKAFTADVSHELRTPLMVISSSTELLQCVQNPAQQTECILKIQKVCERIQHLTQVFLALARNTDADAMHAVRHENLEEIAQFLVDTWQEPVQKKSLYLKLENHLTRQRSVPYDFAFSLLDNLIRNAVQYTTSGGITIELNDTHLRIIDTGCGIPSEEKSKVLQEFVRGASATGQGYGWGLSLVKRITAHLGWDLSYVDNTPCGMIFTIRFDK